jgi:P4 family phage/plasmid primase-like protien
MNPQTDHVLENESSMECAVTPKSLILSEVDRILPMLEKQLRNKEAMDRFDSIDDLKKESIKYLHDLSDNDVRSAKGLVREQLIRAHWSLQIPEEDRKEIEEHLSGTKVQQLIRNVIGDNQNEYAASHGEYHLAIWDALKSGCEGSTQELQYFIRSYLSVEALRLTLANIERNRVTPERLAEMKAESEKAQQEKIRLSAQIIQAQDQLRPELKTFFREAPKPIEDDQISACGSRCTLVLDDEDDSGSSVSQAESVRSEIVTDPNITSLKVWEEVGLTKAQFDQFEALVHQGEKYQSELWVELQQSGSTGPDWAVDGCKDKRNAFYQWDATSRLWCVRESNVLRAAVSKKLLELANTFKQHLLSRPKPLSDFWNYKMKMLGFKIGDLSTMRYVTAFSKWLPLHVYNLDPHFTSKLNKDISLLPTKGGMVVDLRTGECRYRVKTDYITEEIPTYYRPDVDTSMIQNLISQMFDEDNVPAQEKTLFMQRFMGYALTGDTTENRAFILVGEGSNGKSLLTRMLDKMLGPLFTTAAKEVFIRGSSSRVAGGTSSHMMALKGKRVAVCSETAEGDKIDEAQLKMLTGGDQVTGRRLHENVSSFDNMATCILLTNHKPTCSTDYSLWRRLVLINFPVLFMDEKDRDPKNPLHRLKDTKLGMMLTTPENLSMFLTWCVKGAVQWYNGGLQVPQCIELETEVYRSLQDSLAEFLSSECEMDENSPSKWKVDRVTLYDAYSRFCTLTGRGDTKPKLDSFVAEMKKKQFEYKKSSTMCFFGLKLNELPGSAYAPKRGNLDGVVDRRYNYI